MQRKFIIVALLLSSLSIAAAQQSYTKHPAYIDIDGLSLFRGSEAQVEITINGDLLELLSAGMEETDDELAEQVANLELIEVRQYKLKDSERETTISNLESLAKQLENKGWVDIVKVKKEDEFVRILYKKRGKVLDGLFVISLDEERQATVVNILGHLDFKMLGKLSRELNIKNIEDEDQKPAGHGGF